MSHPALTEEEAPIHALPDVERRGAWLLLTWRLHQADPALSDPSNLPVDAARLGAWESGADPAPYSAIRALEDAWGLRRHRVVAATDYLRMSHPDGAPTGGPRLDPATTGFRVRRDALLAATRGGTARSDEWLELSWHLAAEGDVAVDTARQLARQLVWTLPRGSRTGSRNLFLAGANLATLEPCQPPLVAAIREYVGEPHSQVHRRPLALLDKIPSPCAAELVLDLLASADDRADQLQAVWLATQKVIRGQFTDEDRARLVVRLLALWRADPVAAENDLPQLIGVLPSGVQQTFARAAEKAGSLRFGYVLAHGEDVPAALASTTAESLALPAAAALPSHGPVGTGMLTRLVREALFHRESERRHQAAMLLGASAYSSELGDGLLTMIAVPGQRELLRERLAAALVYVCSEEHRLRMERHLSDEDPKVAASVAFALAHLEFSSTSDQLLRRTLPVEDGTPGRARLCALGMTGSSALEALASTSGAPGWQREGAAWWLRVGPAIT